LRILVSGSTGLIGSAVMDALAHQGHELIRLVRSSTKLRRIPSSLPESPSVLWNPKSGVLGSRAEGADAVIHLAGASIAGRRWSDAWKRELRESRVTATRNLIASLAEFRQPPKIFIASSAIGFYGSRGDEELTESSPPGSDFLAQLTADWEAQSSRAAEFGARVVLLRFGIVLARKGGALPRMLLPFRLGLGGRIGSGRQWMSWITLDDVVGVVRFALDTNLLSGPANVVSPNPVTNAQFTTVVGAVLHRPTILPAPAFALQFALGEMADSLLLSSQKVRPTKLQSLGYQFMYPELQPALAAVLDRRP
jgi:uncharacterized protein (TIGR01777 family)